MVWHARGDIDLGNLKGRLAAACTSQGIEVVPIQPAVAEKAAAYAGDVDQALAVLSNFIRAQRTAIPSSSASAMLSHQFVLQKKAPIGIR